MGVGSDCLSRTFEIRAADSDCSHVEVVYGDIKVVLNAQ